MDAEWCGKRVFLTGVAGTFGKELLRQLLSLGISDIVGIDNKESALFFLSEEYRDDKRVRLFLGDLRERETLAERMRGCQVIFHVAALKHVGLCEQSPRDAVFTNVLGTQNMIDLAIQAGAERVVFTSSDKAVNPTNVMGTSKLMGERLIAAAHANHLQPTPVFGATRFGNVLGSHGSVVPLFTRQIMSGGPVTLTHAGMSRFVMSLSDAVSIVLNASLRLRGGEVFIPKMPAVRIADLAQVMIEEIAPLVGRRAREIEIREVGPRPGEKLFEELMNEEEVRHALESDAYFIVLPALKSRHDTSDYRYSGLATWPASSSYNSANATPMAPAALKEYLRTNNLLMSG